MFPSECRVSGKKIIDIFAESDFIKLEYLKIIRFHGPTSFEVMGSLMYVRKDYPGYNHKDGDELDKTILELFQHFEEFKEIYSEPITDEQHLMQQVQILSEAFGNQLLPLSLQFLEYGNTHLDTGKSRFHGVTIPIVLRLAEILDTDESYQYYILGPVRLDKSKFEDMFLSLRFV
ncbi:MAG: hypothetical protein V4539_08820 [Bacteroidota bacterium]